MENEELQILSKSDQIKSSIKDSTDKALAALSSIQKITNEKENNKANEILGRVKSTYNKVKKERETLTKPLDTFKKSLMSYEHKLNPTGKDSEYTRIKKMRDDFIRQKANAIQNQQNNIEAERAKNQAINDYSSELKKAIELVVVNNLKDGEIQLVKFKASMTLDNWDSKVKMLDYKPKLKSDLLSNAMKSVEVPTELTEYDSGQTYNDVFTSNVNRLYQEYEKKANAKLSDFKKSLPAYKKQLKQGIYIATEQQIQIIEAKADNELKEKIKLVDNAKDDAFIDNEFKAQVQTQSLEELSGVRKQKIVRLKHEDGIKMVEAISKAIIHCITDSKFKGIFKLDSDGNVKKDDYGNSIYIDGIDYWMKYLSRIGHDFKIEGIVTKESIKTIVKA